MGPQAQVDEAQKGETVQLDVILRHLSAVFMSLINYNINFFRKEFKKGQEDFTFWFYFGY